MVRRNPLGTRPGVFTTYPEKVAPRHHHTRCAAHPFRISPHFAGYGTRRYIGDVSTALLFLFHSIFSELVDIPRALAVGLPPFLPLSVHVPLMFIFLFCKPSFSPSFLVTNVDLTALLVSWGWVCAATAAANAARSVELLVKQTKEADGS